MDIKIRDGKEEDFAEILPLCDERYGSGYLTKGIFDHWMEHKSLLKIAEMGEEFAGFAVMVPATVEEVMEKMAMPREDVEAIAGGRPALIYKSAAVLRQHEHKGVMHALALAGLETARREGYGSIFASAWVYNGKSPLPVPSGCSGSSPCISGKSCGTAIQTIPVWCARAAAPATL